MRAIPRRSCCGRRKPLRDHPERLLSGPAKLCDALGVTRSASGIDLVGHSRFRIFLAPKRKIRIGVSPRIGVDYAGEAAAWPLRFFDRASPRGLRQEV